MRFSLIDRILRLDDKRQIVGIKSLSLAEDYLRDHFPTAPVMPGVLMLESLTQAAAWLIRGSEDFAHSIVLLKEVKSVKYGSFVEPGQTMNITAEVQDWDERQVKFKAQGTVAGITCASARLVLERYNLADTSSDRRHVDEFINQKMRELYSVLYKPEAALAVAGD